MPRALDTAARALVALVMIVAMVAIGFFPAYLAGFAWGLIAVVVVGGVISWSSRGGIDGAYTSLLGLILLAIGFVAGLAIRWGQAWFG